MAMRTRTRRHSEGPEAACRDVPKAAGRSGRPGGRESRTTPPTGGAAAVSQEGETLYKISQLMGNSPEICRRHYAALVPEKMRDVVEFASDDDGWDGQSAGEPKTDRATSRRKRKKTSGSGRRLRVVG